MSRKQFNAEDVRNILSTFAEGFLVDIPAKHIDGEYLIGYDEIQNALTLGEDAWFEEIAAETNANVVVFGW